MATKARSRQKKTKSRPYGRYLLILLALASLAGLGYFVFLQAPLFPPAAEQAPTAPPAVPAQPPAEEPLTTPAPPAAPQTTASKPPSTPPVAASSPTQAAEPTLPTAPAPKAVASSPPRKSDAQPPIVTPASTKAVAPPTVDNRKKPLVAIVIDDMGYQLSAGQKMLALPLDLSFSFLPFGPHTKELAAAAQGKKRDILLHLPLEATDRKVNPGPGTLTVAMTEEELRTKFAEELAAVPMAIGCNNHMGSRFTEQRPAMTILLNQIKQRGLFFLDSRTSAKSVGCDTAKELGVPCLSRHFFLDNDQETAKVIKQLDALLALAEKKGWAVGIGHPHPATLAALTARQQALTDRVKLVGIGTLVRTHVP